MIGLTTAPYSGLFLTYCFEFSHSSLDKKEFNERNDRATKSEIDFSRKDCIGRKFRGENENVGITENGNFLGIMRLNGQFDPLTSNHIAEYGNEGKGRASYPSSTIYEEIIQLIIQKSSIYLGNKLLESILDWLRKAKYFSFCVNSTSDLSH